MLFRSPSTPHFLSRVPTACSSASGDPLFLSRKDVVLRSSASPAPCAPPRPLFLVGEFSFAGYC